MINKIKITNLADAESYSFGPHNDFDVWVSAVDMADKRKINRMKQNFDQKGIKSFAQFFYDWSEEDGHTWSHLASEGPEKRHIQNIITFLTPFVNDDIVHNLGINCFAGISRSTAIAITALVMSGKTIGEALTHVLKIRPEAWPNLRILGFASEILGQDIKTPVAKWKKDCLDCTDIFLMPDRKQPLNDE